MVNNNKTMNIIEQIKQIHDFEQICQLKKIVNNQYKELELLEYNDKFTKLFDGWKIITINFTHYRKLKKNTYTFVVENVDFILEFKVNELISDVSSKFSFELILNGDIFYYKDSIDSDNLKDFFSNKTVNLLEEYDIELTNKQIYMMNEWFLNEYLFS